MIRAYGFALLLAVWGGCASDGPAPSGPAPSPESSAPDPETATEPTPSAEVRPGVRIDRLLAPTAPLPEVVARLREPRSRTAEPIENRQVRGQIDTIRTWRYDGLTLELYDVSGGRLLLQRLAVTSDTYGTTDGLSVGEPRDAIESTLGAPVGTEGDVVTYRLGDELPTAVEVRYQPDEDGVERATAIEWRPPIG